MDKLLKSSHLLSVPSLLSFALILTLTRVDLATKQQQTSTQREANNMPTVKITNDAWEHVNLEVRTGNQADPEQNQIYTITELGLDEGVNIDTDEPDVNYRRDPDPDHPDGTWNEWTTVATLQPYQEVFLGVGL